MSDILKEKLGEELFNQVNEKIGDLKIDIITNSYIPLDRFNQKNEEVKLLKDELSNRDNQLNELKTKATGNEELSKKIEELNNLNQTTKTTYEEKIKDLMLSSSIEKLLISNQAKHPELLISKINKSSLKIKDDGSIDGLNEQITELKNTYKDLFGETKIVGGSPNKDVKNPTPTDLDKNEINKIRKAAGLAPI